MNQEEAKELCLLKWKIMIDDDGKLKNIHNHPKLKHLSFQCGYCELYVAVSCKGCPLHKENKYYPCCEEVTTNARRNSKANAQAVYDLIKNSPKITLLQRIHNSLIKLIRRTK